MPRRLKLIVAYDGAPYAGWQSQANGNGVQDHLESVFARIGGEAVRVHGAGRTDAGAHALAQCAHVDLGRKKLTSARWTAALNGLLPPTIRVLRTQFVSDNFHARFSAKGKIYRYQIFCGDVLPPIEYGKAWHVIRPVDVDLIKSAAALFEGTHDFADFAANRGKAEKNTARTLRSVRVRSRGQGVILEFDGDGFLYKMVRLIVGALVECGSRKSSFEELAARLSGKSKSTTRSTAPAHGLFLIRVRY
jgi:tRNA pseudouridine38-40 synthase